MRALKYDYKVKITKYVKLCSHSGTKQMLFALKICEKKCEKMIILNKLEQKGLQKSSNKSEQLLL